MSTPDPDNPQPRPRPRIGGTPDRERPENRGVTGEPERLHWVEDTDGPVDSEPSRWSMATVLIVCACALLAGVIVIASMAGGCLK